MLNTILGTKKQMGQVFVKDVRVPVTYIKAGPCLVSQIKNIKKDGYWAIQLGFGVKKVSKVTKPLKGHLKTAYKNSPTTARFLREVRIKKEPEVKVGDKIRISDIFSEGDIISVTGVSKGKGFAGVVKRWGFAGGPRTHGQSDRERAPGSISQGTSPGRVHKSKKMPGRMGTRKVTIKNKRVISVDKDNNLLAISGSVPGGPGTLLKISKLASGKIEDFVRKSTQKRRVIEQVTEESEESKSVEATE